MFVTKTDFDVPPLNLSGLDKVSNTFPEFITEQEEEELSKLFGVRFWEAFKAGLDALPSAWVATTDYAVDALVVSGSKIYKSLQNPNLNHAVTDGAYWAEQVANRWLLLREGDLYTYNDVEYKWVGMTAMVKPMIYSLWVKYRVNDQMAAIGNVKSKAENSEIVSPNVRICRAWNQYDSYAINSRRGTVDVHYANTLFGYLWTNSEDFDDVVTPEYSDFEQYLLCEFLCPGRQNVFDL